MMNSSKKTAFQQIKLWNNIWKKIAILLFLLGVLLPAIWVSFSQYIWGMKTSYYENIEWKGAPLATRIENVPYLRKNPLEKILPANQFSVLWDGWISIKESGTYRFATRSDDGSFLKINGHLIIDNGGAHGKRERWGEVYLKQGVHHLEIFYFQIGGFSILETFWLPPSQETLTSLPTEILFSRKPFWFEVRYREMLLQYPHIPQVLVISFFVLGIIIFLVVQVKKTSLRYVITSSLLSILSIGIFAGSAELIARRKYTPRKIDYKWIFEYDRHKIFRLKKNHTGEYGGVTIHTNSFGFREHEIDTQKPLHAKRIIVLGDSITFGHGKVLQHELYSERLEQQLNQHSSPPTIEVINTGCPGNSALQEYYDLLATLPFEPDMIILQYTLNDVTEPYLVYTRHGGKGEDYHGVKDIPYYDYILSQNSAFYLFFKDMINRVKSGSFSKTDLRRKSVEKEIYNLLDSLVVNDKDPRILEAWNAYFNWLEKIIAICEEKRIPCVFLISPYSFQLERPPSEAYPQIRLKDFLRHHNSVYVVDLLQQLQQNFKNEMTEQYSLPETLSYNDFIEHVKIHDQGAVQRFWQRYFLDADHYTLEGHQWVASVLYQAIIKHKLIE